MSHGAWVNGEFKKQSPENQPTLPINIAVLHQTHKTFKKDLPLNKQIVNDLHYEQAIADSGAQTCTAGIEILDQLNIPKSYLIRTRHKIHGVTNHSLNICGSLIVSIKANDRESKQILYICSNMTGLYLSKAALIELGVLPADFPVANSFTEVSQVSGITAAKCGCPLRQSTPDLPEKIPYLPSEENREKLEGWIRNHYANSAFNTCTHQPLQAMTGKPMQITFKEGYVPHAVHCPIPVAHHWKKEVKAQIDADVRLGIIEPIPQGVPTTWCSQMVIIPKDDGSPRRTVDLQKLKEATLRETHHTPSPFNQVNVIPPNKKKSKLDAWNGYHSVVLSEDSKEPTTFITEWGRYRYRRAPQGFHASGDVYTKRYSDIAAGVENTTLLVDDSLHWEDDIESSFWHIMKYIKHCSDNGVVFNPKKFLFARDELEFGGFYVTNDSYRPPDHVIQSIRNFPAPKTITGIRSWFGLINQVAYAFAQAPVMAPFRDLLASKSRKLFWDATLDAAFEAAKEHIVHLICEGVKIFEVARPTCLTTDFSKIGLGYALLQKHCKCEKMDDPNCGHGHWKLINAGSRFTKSSESRYAPTEGEALALVHGLNKCKMFLLGCPNLVVAVDHKPLLQIFNDRALDQIENPRILTLKERSLQYQFKIIYVEGKKLFAPDWLSRNPGSKSSTSLSSIDNGLVSAVKANFLQENDHHAITWERVVEASATSEICINLCNAISRGFPEQKDQLPENIRQFWPMKDSLYVVEGVPFKGCKMLIPPQLRPEMMEALHEGHQGINAILGNARQRLFWPGMDSQLRLQKLQCDKCNERAPSLQKEPMADPPQPEFPFQMVVADFFYMVGKTYLIYADRYSGWVNVTSMNITKASAVITKMRKWFINFGVPEEVGSDGGPPFTSTEYEQFLKTWGVKSRISSAYYPQSNGRAELAVKAAKRILTSNISASGKLNVDSAARALLLHRNSPVYDIGESPASMLFGHTLRDHLPTAPYKMRREWTDIADKREIAFAKRHVRNSTRYNEHAKPLEPLSIGDIVSIQNQCEGGHRRWDNTGVVVEANCEHRQYRVKVDGSNRATLRNRRFLRKIDPVCRTAPYPLQVMGETQQETHPNLKLHKPATPIKSIMKSPTVTPAKSSPFENPRRVLFETPQHSDSADHNSKIPSPCAEISHTERNVSPNICQYDVHQTVEQPQTHPLKSVTSPTEPAKQQTRVSLRRSTRIRKPVDFYVP